jgi:hydrogenase nickel incorporation protein HypA/HybF
MMHEYSIVAALVETVGEIARARGGEVRRVHLRLGELAGVDRALLETAYETFRERTVCAGAALVVHPTPAQWCCKSCRQPIERGAVLRCRDCGAPAHLVEGDDLVLERVELEVP